MIPETLKNRIKKPLIIMATFFGFWTGCTEYNQKQIEETDIKYPVIVADPPILEFGFIEIGSFSQKPLQIGNEGNTFLEVSNIQLNAAGPYTLTIPSPIATIAPDQWVEVLVSYSPVNIADTTFVRVESDDPANPTLEVPVTGGAAFPILSIEPNPYVFEWTEVGSSREAKVSLISSGHAPLTIETLLMLGEIFDLGDIELPKTLDPGESIDLPVFFTPPEEGNFEGEYWVGNNGLSTSVMGTLFGFSGAGSLTGRICDTAGDGWVVGARVYVSIDFDGDGSEDLLIETTTDSEGYFTLDGLPVGTHTVHVEKGSFSTQFEVEFPGGNFELPEEECLLPDSVDIAVVAGQFDHIEGILSDLDLDYDLYGFDYMDLLLDTELLNSYDIVFFNCGMPFDWQDKFGQVTNHLNQYVAQGGSVYASDWAHSIVEATWPLAIDFLGDDTKFIDPFVAFSFEDTPYFGRADFVHGHVTDPTMTSVLGSNNSNLNYDLDAWVVPIDISTTSETMVVGDAPIWNEDYTSESTIPNAPLVIKFSPGGRVIYTTFHNEQQLTLDMELALKEIILSL